MTWDSAMIFDPKFQVHIISLKMEGLRWLELYQWFNLLNNLFGPDSYADLVIHMVKSAWWDNIWQNIL